MVSMEELLNLMVQRGGSDLHISVGLPSEDPNRRQADRHRARGADAGNHAEARLQRDDQRSDRNFEKDLELDFSFGATGLGRFRTNCFMQRGTIAGVLR
jgi:twitching motility protein PilT